MIQCHSDNRNPIIIHDTLKKKNELPMRVLSSLSDQSMPLAVIGADNPMTVLDHRLCPLKFGSSVEPAITELPNKAKIVIVGGGAQGMAIAYKIALRGYGPDTVILDQGQMGGGSTWHAAGIVSLLARSNVEMKLSR